MTYPWISRSVGLCGLTIHAFTPAAAMAQTDEKHEADYQEISTELPKPAGEGATVSAAAKAILEAANAFRARQDLAALEDNEALTKAARDFAEFMAESHRYGHTADGRHPSRRAEEAGYRFCAVRENIAYQYRSEDFGADALAEAFMEGWLESEGHRDNLASRFSVDTGVGVARSVETGGYFAVQMFGRPESESIRFKIINETDAAVEYTVGVEGAAGDGRTLRLSPSVIRTHERCRPASVSIIGAAREAVSMEDGMHLRLTMSADDGIAVQIERAESSEPSN